MQRNRLIRFDWAIKNILRDKANFEILEGFLSELLFDAIKIVKILESESNQEEETDKYNRVDILIENSKKELVIVEVQNENELDFFHRLLYGSAKLITEYLQLGSPYLEVRKVISINIVYFNLGEGQDYIYHGCTTFRGLQASDVLELSPRQKKVFNKGKVEDIFPEYYIIKPNSFDNNAKNTLDEWVYFFKNSAVQDNFTAQGLKQAAQKLNILKLSTTEQKRYKRYLENLSYKASLAHTVRVEIEEEKAKVRQILLEQAKLEGKREKALEIAKNLLKSGVTVNIITTATGLNAEEIENIRQEMGD